METMETKEPILPNAVIQRLVVRVAMIRLGGLRAGPKWYGGLL